MSVESDFAFRIYGDNILECELFVDWLKDSSFSKFEFLEEIGPVDRPVLIFKDTLKNTVLSFHICPYYGGTKNSIWSSNPLDGIFDEKPDVLVVRILEDGTESKPILVIEFDDALQAGNQSWQRSRRAVNSARYNIPYFYVLPIIGWERNEEGTELKSPRYQNAVITLGQLSLSTFYKIPSFQIYKKSPWASHAKKLGHTVPVGFENFHGLESAIECACYYIRNSVYEKSSKPYKAVHGIISEMLLVGKTYSDFSETSLPIHKSHPALQNILLASDYFTNLILDGKEDENSDYRLDRVTANHFFTNGALFFKDAQKKTTTPDFRQKILEKLNWKPSATRIQKEAWLSIWGITLKTNESPDAVVLKNKDKVPITYKEKKSEAALINNRKFFRKIIETAYPNLSQEIFDWIYLEGKTRDPIFFVPLYGYKPTGDSRPDRGLIPFLFSLFPRLVTKENTVVIMYSVHTPDNWDRILNQSSNELWNVIKEFSGLLIVDKTKSGVLMK